jgi:hypothetical protein
MAKQPTQPLNYQNKVNFNISRDPKDPLRKPRLLQLSVVLHTRVKELGHLVQLLQFCVAMLDRLVVLGSAENGNLGLSNGDPVDRAGE